MIAASETARIAISICPRHRVRKMAHIQGRN